MRARASADILYRPLICSGIDGSEPKVDSRRLVICILNVLRWIPERERERERTLSNALLMIAGALSVHDSRAPLETNSRDSA